MFATEITINTDNLHFPDVVYIVSHHWGPILALLGIVGAGVALSFVTELYKRRVAVRRVEVNMKKVVAKTLAVLSFLVTASAQVVAFVQANDTTLITVFSKVPHMAEVMASIVAVSYFFYNLGGKKPVKKTIDLLAKWSGAREPIPSHLVPEVTQTPEVEQRNLIQ